MASVKKQSGKARILGLVCSSEPSLWISCRTIVPNLQSLYENHYRDQIQHFPLNEHTTPEDYIKLALKIFQARPSRLVFLDHRPHPTDLLVWLNEVYGSKPLPEITFHIFGDFTYFAKKWLALEPVLKKFKVHFVCASERQGHLLSRFLAKENSTISTCPFPIDHAVFRSNPKARASWRKKMKIGAAENVVCYTGRLSLQKNTLQLLREFVRFSQISKVPAHFVLAGPFDDLGAPFFGIQCKQGYYFQQWQNLLNNLPPKVRKRIHYLGELSSVELSDVYNGSDLYVSLSLHHDEDFGMSPAEALCTGTPAVLTDWGGYAAFSSPSDCMVLPVKILKRGLSFSSEDLQKALSSLLENPPGADTHRLRTERSARALKRWSHPALSPLIEKFERVQHQSFQGFNWRLLKYVEADNGRMRFPLGPSRDTFYEEIYGVYAGERE